MKNKMNKVVVMAGTQVGFSRLEILNLPMSGRPDIGYPAIQAGA